MAKHLILLDSNANPLFDNDLAEEVSTFGELKLYLNRLATDDKKPLSWWDNLEVLDSSHNKYEKGDDALVFDEYDGIENCIVLYTKQKAKKQESGANEERSRILARIKELKLGAKIKEKYGKNQTQVSSQILLEEIAEAEKQPVANSATTASNESVKPTNTEETSFVSCSGKEPENIEEPEQPAPKSEEPTAIDKEEQYSVPEAYDEIRILIPRSLKSIIKVEATNSKKRNFALLQTNNPFKK